MVVAQSCLANVIGEDPEGARDRLATRSNLPVARLCDGADPHLAALRAIRESPGFAAVPARKGAVNVVGLPRLPGDRWLLELLEDCGITVHCRLLPEVDPTFFRTYLAAELQVFYPSRALTRFREAVMGDVDRAAVSPPPPFGVRGTWRWLMAIAGALGREDDCQRVW